MTFWWLRVLMIFIFSKEYDYLCFFISKVNKSLLDVLTCVSAGPLISSPWRDTTLERSISSLELPNSSTPTQWWEGGMWVFQTCHDVKWKNVLLWRPHVFFCRQNHDALYQKLFCLMSTECSPRIVVLLIMLLCQQWCSSGSSSTVSLCIQTVIVGVSWHSVFGSSSGFFVHHSNNSLWFLLHVALSLTSRRSSTETWALSIFIAHCGPRNLNIV